MTELEKELELDDARDTSWIKQHAAWDYELFRKYPDSYKELH